MKSLYIDTHSEKVFIAIYENGNIKKIEKISNKSHSEIVIPCLQELLNECNIGLNDIDEIVVVNGPGSFTGVRIGVTIAKTIAYSLNIPIKTITSLEAYGISENDKFDIIAVSDTKGAYSACYEANSFKDFSYRKNSDFNSYIKANNYKVSTNDKTNLDKILNYLKDKDYTNAHLVNPIYIKEIDALK